MSYHPNYKYIPPISFSILTPLYDFFCTVVGLGTGFRRKVLNSIKLHDGVTVADIGCGTGVFLEVAGKKYPQVHFIGLDPDKQALGIAARRLSKSHLPIELKESFAEALPLGDKSIDICFSTLAFHHMPDDIKRKAIKEIHRILKPGGFIIIADFGEIKNRLLRKFFFFENLEYLEGNFNGLIPQYLKETGFKEIKTVESHFPMIKIIKAQRTF